MPDYLVVEDTIEALQALARRKGRQQSFEFELFVLAWQAGLASSSRSEPLARLTLRDAAALRARLRGMDAGSAAPRPAPDGLGRHLPEAGAHA